MARKLSFWEGIKAQFSTKCLVLIPIAVGINLIGGTLCSALKLPLFLDMIGTIVVACLSGPWVAALTGLLTNLFLALVANPVYLPYAAVSVLCGLVVGYMVKAGLLVVPEKLRTLDRGRPWRDSQFASTRLSPSRDMSR